MGHLKARLVDRGVPVEQEVEVEGPRPPGRAFPGSPEVRLGLEQHAQQVSRRERRLERDRTVEERRLIRHRANGVGLAERRDADYLDPGIRSQRLNGRA